MTLEILDAAGKSVRRYSSADAVDIPDPAAAPVPVYWYRRGARAAGERGIPPRHVGPALSAAARRRRTRRPADRGRTTRHAPGADVAVGGARPVHVRLTVDGQRATEPLTLKMDPRVTTPALGLTQQFTLSKQLCDGILAAQTAQDEIRAMRDRVSAQRGHAADERALVAFQGKLTALEGQGGGGRGGASGGPETLANAIGAANQLMTLLQGADVAPTTQLAAAAAERRATVNTLLARWTALKAEARALSLTNP